MKATEHFSSGPNVLSGICTLPEGREIKAGLIFIHAADGNRLGPHRMFVELAHHLKPHGIACFRFDMRGCGDSSGVPAGDDIAADIEDLLSAIRFFTGRYAPAKTFLLGISRGARVGISTLAQNRLAVDGAILLSTPFSGVRAGAQTFSHRLKEYWYKFRDPQTRREFLSGRAHVKQIAKTLGFALTSQKRYRGPTNDFITRCPLLFIYGGKDPIAADSRRHYDRICETFHIPFRVVEIADANHSFFHYRWKEQIMQICEQWLSQNLDGDQDGQLF